MHEQAQVLWLENTTSFPEPSHQNTLKNCLQKQTVLLPVTLELFSAQHLSKEWAEVGYLTARSIKG